MCFKWKKSGTIFHNLVNISLAALFEWVYGQQVELRSGISNLFIIFNLVGGWATPLKNMSSSIGMMKFPILMGK